MADDWYYTRHGERQGPVTRAKLVQLARDGWLTAADLVWTAGMPAWAQAGHVPELAAGPLGRALQRAIDGIVPAPEPPPRRDDSARRPRGRRRSPEGHAAWNDLAPRHLLAAAGAFLAALGIAFTAIGGSAVALAFTLGGLTLAALGMHVEVGRLTAQALANLGAAWREAATRRHEARKLALENRRLELEVQRIAQGRPAVVPPPVPTATPTPPGSVAAGRTILISHPPVQRWSPGLAAILSVLVPGLGQLYKGQVVNGIVWFFIVGMGYLALVLPGLVLHLCCILGAAGGNPWREGRTEVVLDRPGP